MLYTLIAALISAAWLPVFLRLYRHPQLVKPHLPATIFASQVLRPAARVLLYVGRCGFIHPILAVSIFVFIVGYYAWTSPRQGTASPIGFRTQEAEFCG